MADSSDKVSRDRAGADKPENKAPPRLAARAGPGAAKMLHGLRRGGQNGLLALRRFSTGQLRPRLQQASRWLRWRVHPSTIDRDYRRLLLLLHKLGPDRAIERLCFVRTGAHIPLSILSVPSHLRRSGHDYRPTPRLVFKWAMEAVAEPFARYAFVDYGAGRGRVLLLASHYPFEKITGAESAAELYDDCLLNIAQYPRSLMKCRDVECRHLSALRLDVPEEETVFFFNNPFNRSMLERVAGKILSSCERAPRRCTVVCVDIGEHRLFAETGIFREITIPWRQRLKIAAFSPYSIAIYRSEV
ncbi:MAG: hypothetical protein IIB62_00465 [Proteobacteria bacterium]|nr:hypothetical protein [Pseudomonadota bacterium]